MKSIATTLLIALIAATGLGLTITPPMPPIPKTRPAVVKGAQATQQAAKASFLAVQPPPITTNYLTLGFYSGNDFGNGGRVFIQSTSDLKQPFTNVVGYFMGDSNVTQKLSFTNSNRFFRLHWLAPTNTYNP